MAKMLHTSSAVRKAVIDLFSHSNSRRVAISAFVGDGAEAYLPKPKSLELICWPKAGGTNPNTIRKLIKKKVKVRFADSLHMKVYWTEDLGAVVTSANLSTNALGSGNLKEIGVQLPAGALDIDRVITSLKPYKVTNTRLLKLDDAHKDHAARNAGFHKKSQADTWADWYALKPWSTWKLGWYDDWGDASEIAQQISKRDYGISDPFDILSGSKGDYSRGNWILGFYLKDKPSRLKWFFVDYYVRVPKSDTKVYNSDWPFQAVQVHDRNKYPAPPFRIDTRLRKAFAKTVEYYGADKLMAWKSVRPSKNFIATINKYYQQA